MLDLGIFGLKFEIILSYSKSATSNLSKCKIFWGKKCPNLGPKIPFLSIFRLESSKIVIFEISTLESV